MSLALLNRLLREAQKTEPVVLDSDPIYYVYGYFEPGQDLPFYIGKDTERRAWMHLADCQLAIGTKFYNKLKKLLESGVQPIIKLLKEGLIEKEAFDLEIELIKQYGRLDLGTGCLTNLTEGGDGSSGRILSEESRKKISINNMFKEVTLDTRIKYSHIKSGDRESEETKRKKSEIAIALRGKSVESYDLKTGQTIKVYIAIAHVERDNLQRSLVRRCANGITTSYRGVGWRFV